MSILIFLGIPILLWAVVMLLSLREDGKSEETPREELKPQAPPQPDSENALHFSRDYTGRVWVDRKRKGVFPTIRRRGVTPPNDLEE